MVVKSKWISRHKLILKCIQMKLSSSFYSKCVLVWLIRSTWEQQTFWQVWHLKRSWMIAEDGFCVRCLQWRFLDCRTNFTSLLLTVHTSMWPTNQRASCTGHQQLSSLIPIYKVGILRLNVTFVNIQWGLSAFNQIGNETFYHLPKDECGLLMLDFKPIFSVNPRGSIMSQCMQAQLA